MLDNPAEWLNFMHSSEFMPHGHCYLWKADLLLLHVVSDALIAVAYYSIPVSILYVVRKRDDLPYPWLLGLFAAFITACGTTHLLAVWTAWNPAYWLSGGMKAITAFFSIVTAIVFIPVLPKILALRSPRELEIINEELRQEIRQREAVEAELKRATTVAEAASTAKSEFLARVSHELRTPLNGIIGMTTLLRDTEMTRQQEDYFDVIKDSGDNLLTLINDLLDLSRVELGKLDPTIKTFKLEDTINNTLGNLTPRAIKKGVQIRSEIEAKVPAWLRGDPLFLNQILTNLLENAIKFTESGSVSLSVTSQPQTADRHQLRFAVTDTGIGIAPHQQESLFESFVQANETIRQRYAGAGLGLAICKLLVEGLGGSIGVLSEEGKGSTFWFTVTLPTGEAPAGTVAVERATEDTPVSSGAQVLVAEDNPTNQRVVLAFLAKFGIHAALVENGAQAVDLLQQQAFDLVLMDCEMPEMNGFQATEAIRASSDARVRETTIVALTANAMAGERERCLARGMNDYLAKPIMLDELRNLLEKWSVITLHPDERSH